MSETKPQAERLVSAQVGVLGAMLIDCDCVADVLARTSERMFVSEQYRTVYRAIRQLFQAAKPVDPVTVADRLRETAGADYRELLLQVMDLTPTSANVLSYVDILRRESIVWRLRQIGAALADTEDLTTCEDLMSKANAAMSAKEGVEIWSMRDMWEDFVRRHSEQAQSESIRWGYDFIDERVHTSRGDFCVLGGYSSVGKTCLGLAMALKMGRKHKVGFFSYETDKAKLSDRIMSSVAMVDFGSIKRSKLGEKEWEALAFAASQLAERGVELIQCSGFTVSDIQSLALSRYYDVIYVDYLQLIEPEGRKGWSRPEEVGAVSRGLQRLAHQHGVTVVALAQLTPGENRRKNEAPTMYDLRESKQITMDADVIFLLYLEDIEARGGRRILKCDKNKDGEAGWYKKMVFRGEIQTFEPAVAPVEVKKSLPDQVSIKEIEPDGSEPF